MLHRPGKQGLGTAYIQGFLWALARAYDYVFEMDADFSHDPNDLPRMREAVQHGADVAVGSRWVAGGGTRNWSFLRTFISRGGSIYARLILGIPVNDLTSGFKCFSRHVLERLDLQSIRSNGYAFQVEMNYRCYQHGFSIAEVPITFVDRRVGKSKMGGHIVREAMLVVLGLRMQSLFGGRQSGDGDRSDRGEVLQDSLSAAVGERLERGVVVQQAGLGRIRQEQRLEQRRWAGPAQAEEVAVRLAREQVVANAAIDGRVAKLVRQRPDHVALQRLGQREVLMWFRSAARG